MGKPVGVGIRSAAVAVGASIVGVAAGLKVYTDARVRQAEQRYPPQGAFVTVDGIALHYVAAGTGHPVVLIHGDGGSVYDWTLSTFARLAQAYHVVAFDRPGFGYSARPANGASPLIQARLIRAAMQALGLEQPVVVGHSRGGQVAMAYGLEFADEIAGVVDLAGGVFFDEPWTPLRNRLVLTPVVGPALATPVMIAVGRDQVAAGLEVVFAPESSTPPAYVDAYAAMLLRPGPLRAYADDQVHSAPAMKKQIPRYREFRVPLVILNGTEDRSTPIEHARRLHAIVPGSELVELPGAGHEIMFFHPDRVLAAITTVVQLAAP